MSIDPEPAAVAPRGSSWTRLFANPYLLLALAGLLWSGNHIAGRAIAGDVPPLFLSALRWLLGAIVIYPFARRHLPQDWPTIRTGWRPILFLSILGGAIFSALQYVGLQWTTALNVSVFNSFSPVMMVAAGALFFRDRLRLIQLAGILTSLSGVLIIVAQADVQALAALSFNVGDLVILFNMGVWAVYSACLRLRPKLHWTSFTLVLAVLSSVITTPFAVWEFLVGMTINPSPKAFFVIAYVSTFSGIVAFACWNRGIEMIGSGRGGVFLHLIPIYGALLATTLLGEQLMPFHIAGFVLILCGVYLAVRSPSG